jgi:hypothetical protein
MAMGNTMSDIIWIVRFGNITVIVVFATPLAMELHLVMAMHLAFYDRASSVISDNLRCCSSHVFHSKYPFCKLCCLWLINHCGLIQLRQTGFSDAFGLGAVYQQASTKDSYPTRQPSGNPNPSQSQ